MLGIFHYFGIYFRVSLVNKLYNMKLFAYLLKSKYTAMPQTVKEIHVSFQGKSAMTLFTIFCLFSFRFFYRLISIQTQDHYQNHAKFNLQRKTFFF